MGRCRSSSRYQFLPGVATYTQFSSKAHPIMSGFYDLNKVRYANLNFKPPTQPKPVPLCFTFIIHPDPPSYPFQRAMSDRDLERGDAGSETIDQLKIEIVANSMPSSTSSLRSPPYVPPENLDSSMSSPSRGFAYISP